MDNIQLSIVIGTYNRLDMLRKCLGMIVGQINVSHEIIVVDAGSTDGTIEYLKSLGEVKVVYDEQLFGQAKSLNRVFRSLQSKYICWLSDDNLVQLGMLDLAVSILAKETNIGMVALKVKDITGEYAHLPYIGSVWASGVLTCNQGVLPTALLQKLGGFDEDFRDYGIDIDLTTKVLLAGYKVVLTRQVAIHHFRDHETTSWIDTSGRMKRLEMARAKYLEKYQYLVKSKHGLQYDKDKRSRSLPRLAILELYKVASKKGFSLARWIGLEDKDWHNLIMVRFISPFDFLINMWKPYYFVQKIPDALRVSPMNT